MTQRSILAGKNQVIIIKAGAGVTVRGHDSDMVTAETGFPVASVILAATSTKVVHSAERSIS